MSTSKLLNILKDAFSCECNDVFIYSREAELFRKKIKNSNEIALKFDKLSKTELRHADRIAMEIANLGGKTEWEYFPVQDQGSLRQCLKKHLENELKMYKMYSLALEYAEDEDTRLILEGIRAEEKQHIDLISDMLNKIRK